MNNHLYHHGIKGQKWGIRRFQNEDGTLTPAGIKRYHYNESANIMPQKGQNRLVEDQLKDLMRNKDYRKNAKKQYKRLNKEFFADVDKDGLLSNIRDKKGDSVSDEDFGAFQNYSTYRNIKTYKKANAGMAAVGVALAALGGLSVADLLRR